MARRSSSSNGNGHADLIHSSADALASTANYLKGYGWKAGQPWGEGTANFAVLHQWNKADVYCRTIVWFAQQIERNGVYFCYEGPRSQWVASQPLQLTQILNTLFSNALEAMPEGGMLCAQVNVQDGQRAEFVLSDTGKGMSQQQERMVFKPFYTTKQGGLGVGLALVKRIMERFGGSVCLSSREEEGTRVSLIFNIAAGGDHGAKHPGSRG